MLTASDLLDFLRRVFPQALPDRYQIDLVEETRLIFRYCPDDADLRPGGTVAGPTLMGLSDLGMYLAVLASIGPMAHAMTTNLSINFLRKAPASEIVVETVLLKLGRQLAVGEVYIRNVGVSDIISHASVTYSIPSR